LHSNEGWCRHRKGLRRNPAEDLVEFSDGALEILTAGKHDSPSADRAKQRWLTGRSGQSAFFRLARRSAHSSAPPLAEHAERREHRRFGGALLRELLPSPALGERSHRSLSRSFISLHPRRSGHCSCDLRLGGWAVRNQNRADTPRYPRPRSTGGFGPLASPHYEALPPH